MSMAKVGFPAPAFLCDGVVNNEIKKVSLNDYAGKYKILFFYPLDFTFVCPTELHALQARIEEFKKRNVEVLAISVDSAYSHMAWLNLPMKQGGIAGVSYTILADITKTIAKDYGVLHEGIGVALRGTFLLDKENIIQYAATNNLQLGRSIDELVRLVDALINNEKYGEACPANWHAGDRMIATNAKGISNYFGGEEQRLS